jgi:ankyrin repeat protein
MLLLGLLLLLLPLQLGATPLDQAARSGHKEVVELLLSAGASVHNIEVTVCRSPQKRLDGGQPNKAQLDF